MRIHQDRYALYTVEHFISPGTCFPYHFLGRTDLRIDPFTRNRPAAYEEFQAAYGVIPATAEVSRGAWLEWVRQSMLQAPESAEGSACLGPPQAPELVAEFVSIWPRISDELEAEVGSALSACPIASLLKANERLLGAEYRGGGMRFFYNHFASTTTQHFLDDVNIGLQFVRDRLLFEVFVSHELRHVLLDQFDLYRNVRVAGLVAKVVALPSYRQYRSPAAADIEEQMNKVFDAALFAGRPDRGSSTVVLPVSLSDVEIVPVFDGMEGAVLAQSFVDSLPLLSSAGLHEYMARSLEIFLSGIGAC